MKFENEKTQWKEEEGKKNKRETDEKAAKVGVAVRKRYVSLSL